MDLDVVSVFLNTIEVQSSNFQVFKAAVNGIEADVALMLTRMPQFSYCHDLLRHLNQLFFQNYLQIVRNPKMLP